MGRRPSPPHRVRVPVSCRVTVKTLEAIDNLIVEGKFRSTSEVLEAAIDTFFKVNSFRSMTKDPAKAEELRMQMQSIIEEERYEEWMDTLTTDQMTGLIGMLEMHRDGKWQAQKLR